MRTKTLIPIAVSGVLLLGLGPSRYAADDPKTTAFQVINRNKDEIAKVGDAIFSYGELGWEEKQTAALCARLLKEFGYKVEVGISGIPTAIMATYGSGNPVIAIHVEYDAVPGGSQTPGAIDHKPFVEGAPGHAEGHNTNAAVWIGSAYALKQVMDQYRLAGTIKLFSSPAEEQEGSRPFFVRDGYLKDVEVAFHAHVGAELSTSYGPRQYALVGVEYQFTGKAAHAAGSPWTGRNAMNAVELMDIGWAFMREQLPPTQRSSGVIYKAGIQPNVIPEFSSVHYEFRESTYEGAKALYDKAHLIAQGAAMMTGTTLKEIVRSAWWPTRDNQTIAEVVQKNIELVGAPAWTDEEQTLARAIQKTAEVKQIGLGSAIRPLQKAVQGVSSNDSGDITWSVPHGRITFPANVPGVPAHHWGAAIAEATSIAHKGTIAGTKVVVGSIIDVLTHPEILAKAQETFKAEVAGSTYRPLLPADARPLINENAAEMAQYREKMQPFYFKGEIKFK